MRSRRRAMIVSLAAILVSGLAGHTPAAGADPAPFRAIPSDALEAAGRAAMELVEARPADYTGAMISGADNRLTVALPDGPDRAEREAAARRQLASQGVGQDIAVTFSIAKQSQAALERQKERILADVGKSGDGPVSGVGEDAIAGVPVVYLSEESAATRNTVRAAFGEDVKFDRMPAAEPTRTRRLDPEPHWGGAGYHAWNAAHTVYYGACSVAFPVAISSTSTRFMWTAGHCMPGQTSAREAWSEGHMDASLPWYYFGKLYSTTVSGTRDSLASLRDNTQDVYGDWALLYGAKYESNVYTGAMNSDAILKVGEASYSNPAVGTQVCSSGRTTAKVCRLFVTDSDATITYRESGIKVKVTVIRADPDLNGSYDCAGPNTGDSGGAIFQGTSRTGYARAMGLFSAFGNDFWGGCFYYYSPLRGLRDWNLSARVVLKP